jgi:predicted glycosyltransferase
MGRRRSESRLLIYSHDSFGLGHLKRCRTIAHSLVEQRQDISVLILFGSPIIGNFDFHSRVDFVRFPGVIKLRNGNYTPLGLDIGVEEALAIRQAIIHRTAEVFAPDIFLVDKEPQGLRGEVKDTLVMLKEKGARLVLGLRDVMEAPDALAEEWKRKKAVSVLDELYDDIWIYGLESIYNPLIGIYMPPSVHDKVSYTGNLRRSTAGSRPKLPHRVLHNSRCRSPWSRRRPQCSSKPHFLYRDNKVW